MSEETLLYLHHYEQSPYAEKIRIMFGLTTHRWGSVLSPPYPPRPNLQPLVGDFRRIPVAHRGADVFCDTSLIAREVAQLTGRNSLAPEINDERARTLAGRAEGDVFFCAITAAPALPLLGKLIVSNGPGGALKFVRDRVGMMKSASLKPPQGDAAKRVLKDFLSELDEHLQDRAHMQGEAFSYADFAAFHPVWLALSVSGLKSLDGYDRVADWYARIEQLGHGDRVEVAPEKALDDVAHAEPRATDAYTVSHDALGTEVTIAPADYGTTGVAGTLVAVGDDRYVLARSTEGCGAVHLHFPRQGYTVSG